jgi:polysaccharide biosynthesis protein PslH
MKILHLMPYSPVPPNFGGALRTYNILKNIITHHEVTLLLFGTAEDEKNLRREFGHGIKNIHIIPEPWQRTYKRLAQLYSTFHPHSFFHMLAVNSEMQNKLTQLLSSNDFDIVQTEFSHLGSYNLPTNAVKILDAHNVEYDNFRRMSVNDIRPIRKFHYYLEYKKLFKEEIEGLRKQDALFVTSERDKKVFEKDLPGLTKFVVPNGVDSNFFAASTESPEPFSLVFTGMMAYVPNYDGVLYFLDEIFPRILEKIPDAKIYIVGNRPPAYLTARSSNNVIITGYVDDVRPYIRRSSVYVVPLRMGSGTRLKIGEALSMRVPIVTTSIGCEGIDIRSGESAIIADDPASFADGVISLLMDPDRRKKLTNNGFELMKTNYEWSVIGKKVLSYYDLLVNLKNKSSSK